MTIFPLSPFYELCLGLFLEADYTLRLKGRDSPDSRERYAFLDMDYDPFDEWLGNIIIASGGSPYPVPDRWDMTLPEDDLYHYDYDDEHRV